MCVSVFCSFLNFKVYLAEITTDTQTCAKRNVHGRTLKDIMKVCRLVALHNTIMNDLKVSST